MVNVGTKLVLHCIAEGFPVPTIEWYKNDILIPQESSKLYLASTDVPGTATYSCKGRNNAGNIRNTASANITVTVKSMYKSIFMLTLGRHQNNYTDITIGRYIMPI